MDIINLIQSREAFVFACVIAAAALLSFSSRQFGKMALCDLTAGPRDMVKTSMITSAAYAVMIAGVIAFCLGTAMSVGMGLTLGAVAGMIAFVNAVAPAHSLSVDGLTAVNAIKARGQAMAPRAMALFERIDRRGRGLLNEDDLIAAASRSDLNADEKAVVNYLRVNASTIGFISERTVSHDRVVSGGISSGYAFTVPQTTEHYSISLENLADYPARLEQIYKLWD